jgi:hypothetical protein
MNAQLNRMREWLRGGLLLLVVTGTVVGVWQYFFPGSFFTDFPTVALDPPYNEHLMSDVGGLTLAVTAVVGYAAIHLDQHVVRGALVGYLVFAVTHVAFHATHLAGFTTADAVDVVTGLASYAAIPVALLVLAERVQRKSRPSNVPDVRQPSMNRK